MGREYRFSLLFVPTPHILILYSFFRNARAESCGNTGMLSQDYLDGMQLEPRTARWRKSIGVARARESEAGGVVGITGGQHRRRQRPFRQVVHPPPAPPVHAHDLAPVEQQLDRHLDR